ncbi:MAG: hypothetical protein QF681_07340 [Vicinamibacterales bacterium]|jgi:hypothetical protein|nr:hypothetical protein [Vicinamibacterales bacterium]
MLVEPRTTGSHPATAEIAEGGTGEVYHARGTKLDRLAPAP